MVIALRSQKQERTVLRRLLRDQGKSWVEIAETFRVRYQVNARIALRWAHGWSQSRAAGEWNRRWPDDLKTNKHFSCWELWPARTGHMPSLEVLNRLAELYQCRLGDLLADQADYRHHDLNDRHDAARDESPEPFRPLTTGDLEQASQTEILFLSLLDAARPAPAPVAQPAGVTAPADRFAEATIEEVTHHVLTWAQQMNPNIDRRDLLNKLGMAFTVAAAAPLFDAAVLGLDPDERTRVAARLRRGDDGFDEPTLRYCEQSIVGLSRQGDVLGATATLQGVTAHRQIARGLMTTAPAALKPRALSAYAELTQLSGWLCFNAGDHRAAQYYYDEARTAAHEAQDVELVTDILCTMSHLATWQGRPRVGIDHAIAAQVWAAQTGSPHAVGYAANVAARAFAADRQPAPCQDALDAERAAFQTREPGTPTRAWWYFYDESLLWSIKGECALRLGDPAAALAATEHSFRLSYRTHTENLVHLTLGQAEAYAGLNDVPECCRAIGQAATLAATNTSKRIADRVAGLRALLTPHQRSKAVRELDDVLAGYHRSASGGTRT